MTLIPVSLLYSGRGHMSLTKSFIDSSFDAFMIVGMHAYDGIADGILSHNFTSTFKEITVNGLRIGETGYFALLAGAYDIPVILFTGDEAACHEAKGVTGSL